MRKKIKKETNPNCPICQGSKTIIAECSTCHGKGVASYDKRKTRCKICNGNGYTTVRAFNIGRDDTTVRCDSCHGTGYIWRNSEEECWECKGTGSVRESCSKCNDDVDSYTKTKQEAKLEREQERWDKQERERKGRAFNSIFFILAVVFYGSGFVYRLMHFSVEKWSLMANIAGAWYYNLIIAPFVIPWKYVYSAHIFQKALANGILAIVAIAFVWVIISYILGRAYKFINPHEDDMISISSHALFFLAPAICFLIYKAFILLLG